MGENLLKIVGGTFLQSISLPRVCVMDAQQSQWDQNFYEVAVILGLWSLINKHICLLIQLFNNFILCVLYDKRHQSCLIPSYNKL